MGYFETSSLGNIYPVPTQRILSGGVIQDKDPKSYFQTQNLREKVSAGGCEGISLQSLSNINKNNKFLISFSGTVLFSVSGFVIE